MCVNTHTHIYIDGYRNTCAHTQTCMISIQTHEKHYYYLSWYNISSDLAQKCSILISRFSRQPFTPNEGLFY